MSKEFPFVNADAEMLRDGNKIFENKLFKGKIRGGYIDVHKLNDCLALPGYAIVSIGREQFSWELSTIRTAENARGSGIE